MGKTKVYGIDLDGVCFDFLNAFREWLNGRLSVDIKEEEITSYYWYENNDITKEEFFREFDLFGDQNHGYLDLELIEGTLTALAAIHGAGHEIYYITNRPLYTLEDTKTALLYHNFPQRENLHFAKGDKAPLLEKFNVDVFIDDSPRTVGSLAANTRAQVYCRNYPFNSHLDSNDGKWFRRVNNWSEFLKAEGFCVKQTCKRRQKCRACVKRSD